MDGQSGCLRSTNQLVLPFTQSFALPGSDGILKNAELWIGNYQCGINSEHGAKSFARGAGPLWRIEREKGGRGLFKEEIPFGKHVGKGHTFAITPLKEALPLTLKKGRLNRICRADFFILIPGPSGQSVDHEFKTCAICGAFIDPAELYTPEKDACVALLGEELAHFGGTSVLEVNGCQHHDTVLWAPGGHGREDIRQLVALDLKAGDRGIGFAHAGKKDFEVIVDFRDRTHRRARVAGNHFLLDGDGGCQPFDVIDFRFVQFSQELTRIG